MGQSFGSLFRSSTRPRQRNPAQAAPRPQVSQAATPSSSLGIQARQRVWLCEFMGLRVKFEIPEAVTRSTTADIVNLGKTDNNFAAQNFARLRQAAFTYRKSWLNEYKKYNFSQTMPGAVDNTATLEQSRLQYKTKLLEMAYITGIWNCMEFADFALITISEQITLRSGYTAHVASLNDPQIPSISYYNFLHISDKQLRLIQAQDVNHDHAFVVIMHNNETPMFVIDLWQSFILVDNRNYNSAFIDDSNKFINFLNRNRDGRYVHHKVSENHIRTVDIEEASGQSYDDSSTHHVAPSY